MNNEGQDNDSDNIKSIKNRHALKRLKKNKNKKKEEKCEWRQ